MIINIGPTAREAAREKFFNTLQVFQQNGVITPAMYDHYSEYLSASQALGETDTSKVDWDEKFNHRAKAGDASAIDGTHSELVFEAAMHNLGRPLARVTDKLMQRYGQDFTSGRDRYSIKGRKHTLERDNSFTFDLYERDFMPGLFRVSHLVFVDFDGHWVTFLQYRSLFQHCCVHENNLMQSLKVNHLNTDEFEAKYPGTVDTLSLRFLWTPEAA